jgi:hypothetical protein
MMIGEWLIVIAGILSLTFAVIVALYNAIELIKDRAIMAFIICFIIFLYFGGMLVFIIEKMWRLIV